MRAGVLAQRSASSSDDSVLWRARLATDALQETTVNDDQERGLAARRALLKEAAENDEHFARLINSTAGTGRSGGWWGLRGRIASGEVVRYGVVGKDDGVSYRHHALAHKVVHSH